MTGRHEADVKAILADAKDRAWRTTVQNITVDIGVAAAAALTSALESGAAPLTATFWIALGPGVAKTALLIAASYIMRLRKEPATTSEKG